jgi:tetratricopeptide (TPR) repeat protein
VIFLTTGEKIKNLRKKLGMRQQELEDKNMSRAFISMVENGKRGLGKENARSIAEKLNNKASKLGFNLNIDEEYLLRTPKEDAEFYCSEKLNNNPTVDEIDVILKICKDYNLIKIKAESYKILGDYAFEINDYKKAIIKYMTSIDLYKDIGDYSLLPYLYNKIGVCKLNLLENTMNDLLYREAIFLFERANYYAENLNDLEAEKYSLYNIAKIYKILNEWEKALDFTEKYSFLCSKNNDKEGYVAAAILKASCYSEKGNKEKAISLYMELIENLTNGEEILWIIYNNLGIIYTQENNFDKGKECFYKAENIVKGKNIKKLSITFIEKSVIYIKQMLYEEALYFIKEGIKLSLEINYMPLVIKGYYMLIDIYNLLNDFINVRNTYINLLNLIKNKEEYKNDIIKIYSNLALLYLKQNDIEMCKKYLSIIS